MSNFLALSPPKTEKVRPKISSADKLTTINLKVIEANKILKENFLFDKKQLAERAKQLEKTDRQEEESELDVHDNSGGIIEKIKDWFTEEDTNY